MTLDEDVKKAVEVMRQGGVILYPTDTIWGIGCDATNEEAVRRVFEIKKRADSKALICLVDSPDRVQRYVREVPAVAWVPHGTDRHSADHHFRRSQESGTESAGRGRQCGHPGNPRRGEQPPVLPFPEADSIHIGQCQR